VSSKEEAFEAKYPELTKQSKVTDESQAQGDFIEWLTVEKGITLMKYLSYDEDQVCHGTIMRGCIDGHESDYSDMEKASLQTCKNCRGTGMIKAHTEGWFPQRETIIDLLAAYHEIDLKKIETERRQLLHDLQQAAEAGSSK
jgi:hypothetical protein